MKKIFVMFLLGLLVSTQTVWASSELQSLPVQDGGRIKPYDTLARESMQLLYGKETFEGRPAWEIVFTWMLQPTAWEDRAFIEFRYGPLREYFGFDKERKYFSLKEIYNSPKLSEAMQELASKRQAKEKLNPLFQAIQRLESQLIVFREFGTGHIMKVMPPKTGAADEVNSWIAVADFPENHANVFSEVVKSYVNYIAAVSQQKDRSAIDDAKKTLDQNVIAYEKIAQEQNPTEYSILSKSQTEVLYNELHAFRYAWIFYLLAAFLLLLSWLSQNPAAARGLGYAGWSVLGVGFLFHLSGFILRMYLTGRPPVSNMYETVVWVPFGALVFATVIERIYHYRFVIFGGALVGAFCMIIADAAPAILDSSLSPLEPVLRSNFWLTTHVLTITLSYAAFFLAFILGDLALILYFKNSEQFKKQSRALVQAIYRAIQIGIALIGPGIILGGVWADYSWGRFWGWDPKETWALITFLGYLAVLHGRLAGWLRDFGMIITAVVSFSLVVMAWYGVNFWLGAGLHSYGFGAGGVEYVGGFLLLHGLIVVAALAKKQLAK